MQVDKWDMVCVFLKTKIKKQYYLVCWTKILTIWISDLETENINQLCQTYDVSDKGDLKV